MAAERRLSVDWPACKGHGLCAELVPELIGLDEWGYPLLADQAVTRGVQTHVQRAVAACPTLALSLVEVETGNQPGNPGAADPITGALRAVAGPEPVSRTPPGGSSRYPAPAHGQSARDPEPGSGFFEDDEPRRPHVSPQPRTRREARNRRTR